MSQDLSIGIAKTIYIKKNGLSKESITKTINEMDFMKLYELEEDSSYYLLILKADIFTKNIVPLLKELKDISSYSQKESYDIVINALDGKNQEEIEELMKSRTLGKFLYLEGYPINNDVSYIFSKYDYKAYCDVINIENDGDVYFECYNRIFTSLRNGLIKGLNNELKNAVVITIVG